jgi:hypothetical protein
MRSIYASIKRNGVASPLQILLFLDQLFSPPPIFDIPSCCCTTAANCCPAMTTAKNWLVMRLYHLPLPPSVIISTGSHLCKTIELNKKLLQWGLGFNLWNRLSNPEESKCKQGKQLIWHCHQTCSTAAPRSGTTALAVLPRLNSTSSCLPNPFSQANS